MDARALCMCLCKYLRTRYYTLLLDEFEKFKILNLCVHFGSAIYVCVRARARARVYVCARVCVCVCISDKSHTKQVISF